ncbi:hypothetical protein QBC46DRAFT_395137 [Diplogelasinospora grovesii]|uniref:Uncharacterized protein n=1 Tax=Diplogelasinospora grovesii TaxID=303347 RepID=A0AAN6N1F9_9PEZI|nr:hypothetical protein QBC46DRAFT_395137 [Diplogelasinospora grovesii]
MDDPAWSWPFWKFGLKGDDLFTKLHDQYNTFPSSIQDPEAFHHDVYEISHEASTTDEFYRLLQDRKQQRLQELNETLESAAFEIIANPSLIGTDQWQHAVQLFRTKSLDSLVRYFASYLPDDHPWHRSTPASLSETSSSGHSLADSHDTFFFGDYEDGPIMTDEPLDMSTNFKVQLPPSPRSMTMCSNSSAASPIDSTHQAYVLNTLTPARTLSFSGSESEECFALHDSHRHPHDEDISQPCDPSSPATSVSDRSDAGGFSPDEKMAITTTPKEEEPEVDECDIVDACQPSVLDTMESETPTPKPECQSTAFFDTKPSLPQLRYRSTSPSRPRPFSKREIQAHKQNDPRKPAVMKGPLSSPRQIRRECSPDQRTRTPHRRYPGQPATRIQKPLPDPIRRSPRGRRRIES